MNIAYQTENLRDYYSDNRRKWGEFYPSERWVFDRVFENTATEANVLDVGCAAGGLGLALSERFSIGRYTGVDINPGVIDFAKEDKTHELNGCSFFCGDVCDPQVAEFLRNGNRQSAGYSHVISLSCADFNIEPIKIISSCWDQVRPGGEFILSLRLTPEQGVNDINSSYQFISFSSEGASEKEEVANYAVFNFQDALSMLASLSPAPSSILGYGYFGAPSIAARTPFDEVVFSVMSLKKPEADENDRSVSTELHYPSELYLSRERS